MSEAPAAYDFATSAARAIMLERTSLAERGEKMYEKDLARIIREQDALRQDKGVPAEAVSLALKPAERVYEAYPRHVGRTAALKAIESAFKAMPYDQLLAKVTAYAQAVQKWPPAERQYIPHPSTWFNQGRYADDPREWMRGTAAVQQQPTNYSKI